MGYLWPVVLILGGILGCAGLIVAKKPDAKELIGKLQPFQAAIGVALLIFGVLNLLDALRLLGFVSMMPVLVITAFAAVVSAIILGVLFGMPMIAKLSASGAAKGEELGKKLAPFQTLFGLVAIGSGLIMLLFVLGILKPM
jgi:hypothetical protein